MASSGSRFTKAFPPISLIARLDPNRQREVVVKHEFTTNRTTEKREARLPIFNTDNIEQLINVIATFNEHCESEFLDLRTGALRYQKFIEVLRGEGRTIWLEVLSDYRQLNPNSVSLVSFQQNLEDFVKRYLDEGSISTQREYLISGCKKRVTDDPQNIYGRLKQLKSLMKLFPGVHTSPVDDKDMKQMFYNIMPSAAQ